VLPFSLDTVLLELRQMRIQSGDLTRLLINLLLGLLQELAEAVDVADRFVEVVG